MRSHREILSSEKNEGLRQSTNNLGIHGEQRSLVGHFMVREILGKQSTTEIECFKEKEVDKSTELKSLRCSLDLMT